MAGEIPRSISLTARMILLIRHAEKPDDEGHERGVAPDGAPDNNGLTVRGWQRAGALVRFFAPLRAALPDPRLATPDQIFAARATDRFPSRRSVQTVAPLADLLGLRVNCDYAREQEADLARAARAAVGVSLIAWSHNSLPELARLVTGNRCQVPGAWPTDRFDVVWVFDDRDGDWSFHQVPQLLLAGDREQPIPPCA
jgi:hypothetical protein